MLTENKGLSWKFGDSLAVSDENRLLTLAQSVTEADRRQSQRRHRQDTDSIEAANHNENEE